MRIIPLKVTDKSFVNLANYEFVRFEKASNTIMYRKASGEYNNIKVLPEEFDVVYKMYTEGSPWYNETLDSNDNPTDWNNKRRAEMLIGIFNTF